MSIDDLKPTTLAGIKSLANDLKRIRKIKHRPALNLAAQRAGYANFDHAQKNLKDAASFKVESGYITIYWTDEENNQSGRLTFSVPLPKLISKLVTVKDGWIIDRYLGTYKLEAQDHLERILDATSLRHAVELGRSAAYALQLMDKTGLSSANLNYPDSVQDSFRSLVSRDHMSWWQLPAQPSEWVALDEPYNPISRLAWADANGFAAKECYGYGLYRGGGASTTVFAERQDMAVTVAEALTEIHQSKPGVTYDSGEYGTEFLSPFRFASHKKRSPRLMPVPDGTIQNGSIAYGGVPGQASKWRPNGHLSVADHLKIGPVLAALLPLFDSNSEDPLHEVKHDLCNWLYLEHGHELTDAVEGEYDGYEDGGPAMKLMEQLTTPEARAHAAGLVIEVLTRGYPPCLAVNIQVDKLKEAQAAYLSKV